MGNVAIELRGITKRFGSVVANRDVNLSVNSGEILSLLGENGSGKTTLMNMISGIYFPDEGHIFIDGNEVVIKSPKDAFDYKIGMIHQHFKLVDVFTAAENVVLGLEEKNNIKKAAQRVAEISNKYGFDIDPNKKIYEMSVSEKQTVEIIKVLYRGANILILDEPLSGVDVEGMSLLMDMLDEIRKKFDLSILMTTHDFTMLEQYCDQVVLLQGKILRRGTPLDVLNSEEFAQAFHMGGGAQA